MKKKVFRTEYIGLLILTVIIVLIFFMPEKKSTGITGMVVGSDYKVIADVVCKDGNSAGRGIGVILQGTPEKRYTNEDGIAEFILGLTSNEPQTYSLVIDGCVNCVPVEVYVPRGFTGDIRKKLVYEECSSGEPGIGIAHVLFGVKDKDTGQRINDASIKSTSCRIVKVEKIVTGMYNYDVHIEIAGQENCMFSISRNGYNPYNTNIFLSVGDVLSRTILLSSTSNLQPLKFSLQGSITSNGIPIAGVSVTAYKKPVGSGTYRTVSSDENINYKIENLDIGDYIIEVIPSREYEKPDLIYIKSSDILGNVFDLDLELTENPEKTIVKGLVLTEDGERIQGAEAYAIARVGILKRQKIITTIKQTRSNGRYDLVIRNPCEHDYYAVVLKMFGNILVTRQISPCGQELMEVNFQVPSRIVSGGDIHGVVTDKNSNDLISNVVVRVEGESILGDYIGKEVLTGDKKEDKGSYKIFLPPGTYGISAYHPSYEIMSGTIIITKGGEEVNFALVPLENNIFSCLNSRDCTKDVTPGGDDCGICVRDQCVKSDRKQVEGEECEKHCQCSGDMYCKKPDINSKGVCTKNYCEKIIDAVDSLQGIPYYSGNDCSGSWDDPISCGCVGFVKLVMVHMTGLVNDPMYGDGMQICPNAISNGFAIPVSLNDLKPGDIVSMGGSKEMVGHVAIYVGDLPGKLGKWFAHSTPRHGSFKEDGVQYTTYQQMEIEYFGKYGNVQACRFKNVDCLKKVPDDGSLGQNSIYGIVADENGQPIKDVKVRVFVGTEQNPGFIGIMAQTNDEGEYVVYSIGTGEYFVKANHPDYDASGLVQILFPIIKGNRAQNKKVDFVLIKPAPKPQSIEFPPEKPVKGQNVQTVADTFRESYCNGKYQLVQYGARPIKPRAEYYAQSNNIPVELLAAIASQESGMAINGKWLTGAGCYPDGSNCPKVFDIDGQLESTAKALKAAYLGKWDIYNECQRYSNADKRWRCILCIYFDSSKCDTTNDLYNQGKYPSQVMSFYYGWKNIKCS